MTLFLKEVNLKEVNFIEPFAALNCKNLEDLLHRIVVGN